MLAATRTGTQSVERALAIVKAIGVAAGDGMSLAAIAKTVSLNRTTTYRILKCLVQAGAVRSDSDSSRYFLGALALKLGLSALEPLQFRALFASTLIRIAETTGDTVFLLRRIGNDSLCVDRCLGSYPVKTLIVEVGTRRPLGVGAAALAIMQAMPNDEVQEVVRVNANRYPFFDTSAASVLKAVRAAKEKGYVSTRVVGVEGVTAIALPILDPQGHAVAALAVAAIAQRMSLSRQAELVEIVSSEIREMEALLGAGSDVIPHTGKSEPSDKEAARVP